MNPSKQRIWKNDEYRTERTWERLEPDADAKYEMKRSIRNEDVNTKGRGQYEIKRWIRTEEINTKWRDQYEMKRSRDHEMKRWIRNQEMNTNGRDHKEGNTESPSNLTQMPKTKFKDQYEIKRSIRKKEVNKESNTEKQWIIYDSSPRSVSPFDSFQSVQNNIY